MVSIMKTVSIVLLDEEYDKLEKMAEEDSMDVDEFLEGKIKEIIADTKNSFLVD